MLFKIVFRCCPASKKMEIIKDEGVMLGTRMRTGRRVYLYMLKDFFVELVYRNDNTDLEAERLEIFSNLNNLNAYLEKEFKTAF
jgi:hypothetical protein